ncbi:MAG: class I SAM-dependent methyltransferase [Caldimonas sp.]
MAEPSAWVVRWSAIFAPGACVLDVAAGSGRHITWLSAQGFRVTAVDRDAEAMQRLSGHAETIVADLEQNPWPLPGRRFDAVVVTNYLWRPLFTNLVAALAEGGVLVYETFAAGQETVGRPSRPDFLLGPGELLHAVKGLRIVAFEDGLLRGPERFVQRIVAVREQASVSPARYPLDPSPGQPGSVESTDSGTLE